MTDLTKVETDLAELLATCDAHHTKHAPESRCPACSCEGFVVHATIRECIRCGALFGETDDQAARHFVLLGLTMTNEESTRAFDFTIAGRRVHGWFNERSGRVTQLG